MPVSQLAAHPNSTTYTTSHTVCLPGCNCCAVIRSKCALAWEAEYVSHLLGGREGLGRPSPPTAISNAIFCRRSLPSRKPLNNANNCKRSYAPMCDGSLLRVAAKAPSPDQALWPHIIVSKLNQRCLPPLPHLCAYLVVVVESSLATTEGFLASENKKTHYIPIGVSICLRVPLLSPGKKLPCWCTQETVALRYPSKSGSLFFNLSSTPAISESSVLKVFLLSLLFLLCPSESARKHKNKPPENATSFSCTRTICSSWGQLENTHLQRTGNDETDLRMLFISRCVSQSRSRHVLGLTSTTFLRMIEY